MRRHAYHSHARFQHIFNHNRTGTNPDIISNADSTKYLGELPYIDIVTNHRRVIGIASGTAYTTVAVYGAVPPNSGFGVDYNRTVVFQFQPFAETPGADDETEP